MLDTILVIEEGKPLPPPGKTGPKPGGGMLGALTSMSAGQSTLIPYAGPAPFTVWRARVAGLMAAANHRMDATWLVSRREGDGVRVYCIAKAEG